MQPHSYRTHSYRIKFPLSASMPLLLLAWLLAGCATRLGDNITVPVGELAMYDAVPKEQSIARLNNHINDAKIDNMPFLAPHYFREAADLVDKINRLPPAQVATEDLAKADALLDHGEKASTKAQNIFADELRLKVQLDQLNASKVYRWRYDSLVGRLARLIELVELDDSADVKPARQALNQDLQELYTETLQYSSSHPQ